MGIAHTNYQQYARLNTEGVIKSGEIKEGFVNVLNNLVCSAHTDIVVKLSATLPDVTNPFCSPRLPLERPRRPPP